MIWLITNCPIPAWAGNVPANKILPVSVAGCWSPPTPPEACATVLPGTADYPKIFVPEPAFGPRNSAREWPIRTGTDCPGPAPALAVVLRWLLALQPPIPTICGTLAGSLPHHQVILTSCLLLQNAAFLTITARLRAIITESPRCPGVLVPESQDLRHLPAPSGALTFSAPSCCRQSWRCWLAHQPHEVFAAALLPALRLGTPPGAVIQSRRAK